MISAEDIKSRYRSKTHPDCDTVLIVHGSVLLRTLVRLKGTVRRNFLLQVFFHESVSPKPLIIPLGPFQFFAKIRGDIRSSRCTTGVIVDTGGAPRLATLRREKGVSDV